LENARIDSKEAGIVTNSDTVECILTDSEFNALVLESQLIQKYTPRYNVRWRDNKSYLYIKVTTDDIYPKIYATRRENNGKSRYFGPFPSLRSVDQIVRELRKVFPFCTQKKISKQPCFYAKIKQCDPCPNNIEKVSDPEEKKHLQKEYRSHIQKVIKVLEGRTDLILKELYKELTELSQNQQYEEAMLIRNRIMRLESLLHRHLGTPDDAREFNKSADNVQSLYTILTPFYPAMNEPNRVECYDISNLSQREPTASMVVLTEGLVDKREYRKFKIKNETLQSDFEMMDEVLRRRFRHSTWPTPDLLVVDGGKPQVRVAQKVLADMNIDVPLIGIAKNPDRFVIGIENLPTIKPATHNPGFRMIQELRDESHRFAKKYHTYLRDKKIRSPDMV
jgi:excinuclease ABC subunit C